jgi:hypothetical protein
VSGRTRIAAFGSAAALIVIGTGIAVLLGGGVGETLAIVLIGIGLVTATSLVFLEVGLSEDRERDRAQRSPPGRRRRPGGVLGRARGHRRRLR